MSIKRPILRFLLFIAITSILVYLYFLNKNSSDLKNSRQHALIIDEETQPKNIGLCDSNRKKYKQDLVYIFFYLNLTIELFHKRNF